ncbi:hypothetical protein YDYSY3_16840 [Paenibacillus chitinolyticus]|uniref:hypothetical protein n=1 Tax=Paenibacillus chitinolyticus TaxID=79263 RepID=UPI0026E49CAA|nr:hypothetical protein [Paenibacillus chitinolyticus]GKS10684.1 hypothetical protein YDYSY3_16840 [Paenibacillus chitinolyticus]
MKEITSKFMIATAILAAPAAATALQVSAQTVAVQPAASHEASSAVQTAKPRVQAAETSKASVYESARIGSIEEYTLAGPSFGPPQKTMA